MFASCLLSCCVGNVFATVNNVKYKPGFDKYVTFFQNQKTNPFDYIMHLFDKHDVVIIAERDHRETTQWDFIYNLVGDQRFFSRVNNIFIEYGSVSNQDDMDVFLSSPTLDKTKALNLMRNQPIWPEGRNNNNFYNFLLKFYYVNSRLSAEQKIHLNQSDIPWQWKNMTKKFYRSYMEYEDEQGQMQMSPDAYSRDRRMALRIYQKYQELNKSSGKTTKILVIMNSRHGRGFMEALEKPPYAFIGQNLGGCLIKWFGKDKVANILLNDYSNDRDGNPAAYEDGKWDAAYAVAGNYPVGFDLKDTPVGEDYFSKAMNIKYQDIFTGMIFFKPLTEQMLDNDITGFYSEDFKNIVKTRALLIGEQYWQDIKNSWQDREMHPEKYGYRKLINEPGFDKVLQQILQWL